MAIEFGKYMWLLLNPINSLLLLTAILTLFVITQGRYWAKLLLAMSVLCFLFIGFSPLAYWITAPLEHKYPNAPLPKNIAGIILLGGYEKPAQSFSYDMPHIDHAGSRLLAAVMLAKAYPHTPLILSGGGRGPEPEVLTAKRFLDATGFDGQRLRLEMASRNTFENALYSKALAQEKGVWLLVTSASHMPRALATFRAHGIDAQPYATDYMTDKDGGHSAFRLDASENFSLFNIAAKEWLGVFVYDLKGHLDTANQTTDQS